MLQRLSDSDYILSYMFSIQISKLCCLRKRTRFVQKYLFLAGNAYTLPFSTLNGHLVEILLQKYCLAAMVMMTIFVCAVKLANILLV